MLSRGDFMADKKGNSQTRAKNKYNAKNYDSLRIVVQKGKKDVISKIAAQQGESINGYTKKALKDKIKADTGQEIDLR